MEVGITAIPESFIDDLVRRNDILDVVSKYVQLKKKGSAYFGLCPFHNEKTASFSVSQDKQIYHCFGCGAGGGMLSFIMKIEGLDFVDAVHYLANLSGMEVPSEDNSFKEKKKRISRLYELNKAAARFFYSNLISDKGKTAVGYLRDRQLSNQTIIKFGLGYAPEGWTNLISAMRKMGYTENELIAVGLAVRNEDGRIYDRFRNRIMFPIMDVTGTVLAFGGRVLDDSVPKYLNSPETQIFYKGKNLFALNIARKSKSKNLILAEGYMDVISLHQAGFDTAVASLGTALTEEQVKLMTRYAEEITISYDSDEAGRKATSRAIEILKKTDLKIKVLNYAGAKDPDEYIKKNGSHAFELLIKNSENHIEYKLQLIALKYKLDTDDGRVLYLKDAVEEIAKLQSSIEREIYSKKCAAVAGISAQSVENEVKRIMNLNRKREKKEEHKIIIEPTHNMKYGQSKIKYENVRSAAAEEGIIILCFTDDDFIKLACERLSPDDFSSAFLGKVFREIEELYKKGRKLTLDSIMSRMDSEELSHLAVILKKTTPANAQKSFDDFIDIIKFEKMKRTADEGDLLLEAAARFREKKGYEGDARW